MNIKCCHGTSMSVHVSNGLIEQRQFLRLKRNAQCSKTPLTIGQLSSSSCESSEASESSLKS